MKRQTKIILASLAGFLAIGGIAVAAQGYQEHREMKRMFSPQKMLERIDTNGDKSISLDEVKSAVVKRFELADTDSDGSVGKADVLAAIEANVESDRMKRRSGRFTDRLFIGADIDQDGSITVAEIENRISKFYAIADWNDDGQVEMAELKRLRQSMPGRWGKRHGKK